MKITDEQFDRKLAEIMDFDNVKASQLLSVPGVYEIMAEYYNNEVIAALESEIDYDDMIDCFPDEDGQAEDI